MKEEFVKDMENLRKKDKIQVLEVKSFLNEIRKHTWKSLQQTRTSGRQNFRVQRQNRY
jgi:hypothetical protein